MNRSSHCFFNWIPLGFVVLLALATTAQQQATAQNIRLETRKGITAWDVHLGTGRAFATVGERNLLLEYGADGQWLASHAVADSPIDLLVKNDKVVVACSNGDLHVFDVGKNRLTKAGELPNKGSAKRRRSGLFASDVDNNFVYSISEAGRRFSKIYQIDLSSLKYFESATWDFDVPASPPKLSPDGEMMIADDKLLRFNEQRLTIVELNISALKESIAGNHFGPLNRFFADGSVLRERSGAKQMRRFKGCGVQLHPRFDLIASYSDSVGQVVFQNFSNGEVVKIVQMPSPPQSSNKRTNRSVRTFPKVERVTIRFTGDDYLFVGLDDSAYFVQLPKVGPLNLERSVVVANAQDADRDGKVDSKLKTKPVPRSGSVSRGGRSMPTQTPPPKTSRTSPKIAHQEYWEKQRRMRNAAKRPDFDDDPTQKPVVAQANLPTVNHKTLRLDFEVNHFLVNEAGTVAFCFGKFENIKTSVDVPFRLLAVNLETGKILSEGKWLGTPAAIAVVGDTCFVTSHDRLRSVTRFDASNVSEQKVLRMDHKVDSLFRFSDTKLGMFLKTERGQKLDVTVPVEAKGFSNKSIDKGKLIRPPLTEYTLGVSRSWSVIRGRETGLCNANLFQAVPRGSRLDSVYSRFTSDRYYLDGLIRDRQSGNLVALTDRLRLPVLQEPSDGTQKPTSIRTAHGYKSLPNNAKTPPSPMPAGILDDESPFRLHPFVSVIPDPDGKRRFIGAGMGSRPVRPMQVLSPFDPVTWTLSFEGNEGRVSAIGNVKRKALIAPVRLRIEAKSPSAMMARPGKLVVANGEWIHVVSDTKNALVKAAVPLKIQYPKHQEFDLDRGGVFQIECTGGAGKKQFRLLNDSSGLRIDPETGIVEIDAGAFSESKAYEQILARDSGGTATAIEYYNRLFGTQHKNNSELSFYPLEVEVTDESFQIDRLRCYLTFVRSKKSSKNRVAAKKASQEQRVERLESVVESIGDRLDKILTTLESENSEGDSQ